MAFAATTEWDVRTTGSDTNGGGFDTASAGTDYSQQDAAQVAYTDLVIDGALNTKITSALNPFTAAHVGNIINVTGGTGFTVQRIQVVSVASGAATCDKAVGTLGSTGGQGKLGGALASSITAANAAASGNTVHVKAGTYTLTSSGTINNAAIGVLTFVGYNATHNDGGMKPLITTATNSVHLFNMSTGGGADRVTFKNLSMSNTAATRYDAIFATGGLSHIVLVKCLLDGFRIGVNGDNLNYMNYFSSVTLLGTEIKNCTIDAIRNRFGVISIHSSYIHHQTGAGVSTNGAAIPVMAVNSIFASNGGNGITAVGPLLVSNCVFASNTGDGVNTTQSSTVANTIFYGQTGRGINAGSAAAVHICRNNAYGSNTAGNLANVTTDVGAVTLTADPFTNAAAGDFTLNSTAGGGTACKAAGFQWGV